MLDTSPPETLGPEKARQTVDGASDCPACGLQSFSIPLRLVVRCQDDTFAIVGREKVRVHVKGKPLVLLSRQACAEKPSVKVGRWDCQRYKRRTFGLDAARMLVTQLVSRLRELASNDVPNAIVLGITIAQNKAVILIQPLEPADGSSSMPDLDRSQPLKEKHCHGK